MAWNHYQRLCLGLSSTLGCLSARMSLASAFGFLFWTSLSQTARFLVEAHSFFSTSTITFRFLGMHCGFNQIFEVALWTRKKPPELGEAGLSSLDAFSSVPSSLKCSVVPSLCASSLSWYSPSEFSSSSGWFDGSSELSSEDSSSMHSCDVKDETC
eukprot:TRINITY_DN21435_c0_g1_i1.p1 TRINITY_DN21435_c0_g1~~TRINITY_DN21435_c0_g1_i1.p1  ORF type:complete len:156 (+),score=7.53 TRINITY_DN21435_c0_g1_i1:94-561(+)